MFQKDTQQQRMKGKYIFFVPRSFCIWYGFGMICIECNYKKEERAGPWLSLKPLKSFFGWSLLSARPNWDQLGWSVPLQNIVLASVGPTWFAAAHEYTSLQQARPHQSFPRDLLRLNVARNSLNEVPSEALLQLKNLNQLDLSFNKIKYIEENTFAGNVDNI